MSENLKPCPFCNSSNVAQGASRERISVWCFCGAQGPSVDFPDDCIDPVTPIHECHAAWNRRADGWQDAGSAPSDGSVILAYRPGAGVFTAHYVEEDAHLSNAMNPPEGDFYWFATSGEDLTGDMFTHWMPLPNPPAHTPSIEQASS